MKWRSFSGATLVGLLASSAHAGFGDRDCSFGVKGVQGIGFGGVFGVAVEASGDVLLQSGYLSTVAGLYRINANGTTSTAIASVRTVQSYPSTVVLPDGRILLIRYSDFLGNQAGVSRYLASGAIDTTFGVNGVASIASFIPSAGPMVLADGRIHAGGSLGSGTAALVRFNPDCSPDSSFGTGGVATASGTFVSSLAVGRGA